MAAKPAKPERVTLEKFLAGLSSEAAEPLHDVVATMMSNEQVAVRLRGIEAELKPFFITGALSFVAGLIAIIYFAEPGGLVDRITGAWPLVIAALAFFPTVLGYYAIRIRKRSQADIQNFDLNKEHFLPHGAIYFPSDSAASEQMVTLVEIGAPPPKSKFDYMKPGTMW